ncbi:MAG: hypothetical protein U0835_05525 [Isosphaeraceae bacterium]
MSGAEPPGDSGKSPRPASNPPLLPLLLLGLMTMLTFAGPFVIYVAVRGGESPDWPPDRPAEWVVFGVVTGAVVALMAACVTVGVWSKPNKPTGR